MGAANIYPSTTSTAAVHGSVVFSFLPQRNGFRTAIASIYLFIGGKASGEDNES